MMIRRGRIAVTISAVVLAVLFGCTARIVGLDPSSAGSVDSTSDTRGNDSTLGDGASLTSHASLDGAGSTETTSSTDSVGSTETTHSTETVGHVGDLLRFGMFDDGEHDRVTVEDTAAINAIGVGDFTFEAWIKFPEEGQSQHPTIFSNRETSTGTWVGVSFFFHGPWGGVGHNMLCVQLGGTNYLSVMSPDFFDDRWHHVAISRESGDLYYYSDGLLFDTRRTGLDLGIESVGPLFIGYDAVIPDGARVNGELFEVRIWNVARSAQQIQRAMESPLRGDELGLVAAWPLDEGVGQEAMSLTGIGNGTLGSTRGSDADDPLWVDGPRPF